MSSAEAVSELAGHGVQPPRLYVVPNRPDASPNTQMTEYQTVLVVEHLHLVDGAVHRVLRERTRPLNREEAYGDGYFGLCDAALRFDPVRQVTFPTFAMPRIHGAIIDGERSLHKLVGPKKQDAAAISLFNSTPTISMDAPLGPYGGFTLHDVLPSDDKPVDTQALDNLAGVDFYAGLPLTDRQRSIAYLKARKFTLSAIGDQLGVSERTVSRDFKAVVRAMFEAYYPLLPIEG